MYAFARHLTGCCISAAPLLDMELENLELPEFNFSLPDDDFL